MRRTFRRVLLGALAILLSAASVALPRLLGVGNYFEGFFFTAETYGTMVASFLAALLMGLLDPEFSFGWGLAVGLGPCAYGLFLIYAAGGGFPPLPIALVVVTSFLPPVVAASLGQALRER